jgi:hypothetical protein
MIDTNAQFIAYVGDPEIHDGVITNFEHQGTKASVTIKAESGRILRIDFDGVVSVKSNRPEGMMLYSLSEMKHPEHRLFLFTNWEEEDDAYLEITADSYKVK